MSDDARPSAGVTHGEEDGLEPLKHGLISVAVIAVCLPSYLVIAHLYNAGKMPAQPWSGLIALTVAIPVVVASMTLILVILESAVNGLRYAKKVLLEDGNEQ